MKYFILISTLSILFPISFSRILTTFDPPGEFSVPLYDKNNQLIYDYKVIYENKNDQNKSFIKEWGWRGILIFLSGVSGALIINQMGI